MNALLDSYRNTLIQRLCLHQNSFVIPSDAPLGSCSHPKSVAILSQGSVGFCVFLTSHAAVSTQHRRSWCWRLPPHFQWTPMEQVPIPETRTWETLWPRSSAFGSLKPRCGVNAGRPRRGRHWLRRETGVHSGTAALIGTRVARRRMASYVGKRVELEHSCWGWWRWGDRGIFMDAQRWRSWPGRE